MKKQGAQRTHDIPAGYDDDPFEFVINSPTPVAWIMDVDSTKISIGASHTTLSGKNVKKTVPLKILCQMFLINRKLFSSC